MPRMRTLGTAGMSILGNAAHVNAADVPMHIATGPAATDSVATHVDEAKSYTPITAADGAVAATLGPENTFISAGVNEYNTCT